LVTFAGYRVKKYVLAVIHLLLIIMREKSMLFLHNGKETKRFMILKDVFKRLKSNFRRAKKKLTARFEPPHAHKRPQCHR
jgi:hypothetical protein